MWKNSKNATQNIIDCVISKASHQIQQNQNIQKSFSQYTHFRTKQLSANLVAQTIKQAPSHTQLSNSSKPDHLTRDNFICKSTNILKNSNSTGRKRKKTIASKKMIFSSSTLPKEEEQVTLKSKLKYILNRNHTEPLDIEKPIIDVEQNKMRDAWEEEEKLNRIKQEKKRIRDENIERIKMEKREAFSKRVKQQDSFTFDNDGVALFCSKDIQKKSINQEFPITLKYQNQPHPKKIKNGIIKTNRLKNPHGRMRSFFHYELNQLEKNKFIEKNRNYSNNHQRQTSLIPQLGVEAGICFTQPDTCSSVKNQRSLSRSRMSSSFVKYTGKKSVLKEQKEGDKFSKTFFFQNKQSNLLAEEKGSIRVQRKIKSAFIPVKKNRSFFQEKQGQITSVNDSLLVELMQ